jgi:hypothetical protein
MNCDKRSCVLGVMSHVAWVTCHQMAMALEYVA